jgi:hypothetical protein
VHLSPFDIAYDQLAFTTSCQSGRRERKLERQ